jgi:hypothetical protein
VVFVTHHTFSLLNSCIYNFLIGNVYNYCRIKPEPEDDYGDDVAIDIFAEVDADGTVRTSEGRRQWHAGEIVCDGEVELSTETVLN